ncbi:addiction module antidote protein, HigA family [Halioglobus maricola]|uniref:Addiction module antidote protein, HigA family n=1 Tax=Halioglobus maricola TaxID=2601894 RepID=A0A5P9NLQ2_9GAMM|nr:HigA family addiction module antitoxin [Halioglobus maricola]QFU76793.1 addiction module antidote protein, HigA family [Halioglobus maricola]
MSKHTVHPGSLIPALILEPAGISQSMLARQLGFNQPQPVNELVKGKRGITPKMALLLERATDGEYSAEFWLLAQLRWELDQARREMPRTRLAMVEAVEAEAASNGDWDSLLELSAQLRA